MTLEIVLCQLTLDAVDGSLKQRLAHEFPRASVLVAKCIGCCGECASSYAVLLDGQPLVADSSDALVAKIRGR